MKYITGVLLMLITLTASAQTVELEQDVDSDTVISKFGRNRQHFVSTVMGLGYYIGNVDHDSIQLRDNRSSRFTYGVYYKYKASKAYSLVASVNYGYSEFNFITPEDVKYDRLILGDFNAEVGNRINFGKRGNRIGNYFEVTISGDYIFRTKEERKQTIDNPAVPYKVLKTDRVGLNYVEPFNYTVHARLGFNKFVLAADYRLSDVTNEKLDVDLPPLTVGLRFDFGAN
jgi:hypothetical protein